MKSWDAIISLTAEYVMLSAPATPPCSRPRYTACLDARTDIGETFRISLRPAPGAGHRLPLGHDLVDEPELVALLRRHVAAGEDHAERPLRPDRAGQAVHAAGERGEADAHLGQGEPWRSRRRR